MTDEFGRDSLFSIFVLQQQHLAWLYLGKMANPATGDTELNLEAAKFTIDMLGMIETKTSGNLTADEESLLGHVLTTLRLNYMEEARKAESSDSGADQDKDSGASETNESAAGQASEPAEDKAEDKASEPAEDKAEDKASEPAEDKAEDKAESPES